MKMPKYLYFRVTAEHGTPVKVEYASDADVVEVVRCKDCKYNYGLTHGGEFNPDDIVCTYFDTDGMRYCDFCSYGER